MPAIISMSDFVLMFSQRRQLSQLTYLCALGYTLSMRAELPLPKFTLSFELSKLRLFGQDLLLARLQRGHHCPHLQCSVKACVPEGLGGAGLVCLAA